MPDSFFLPFPMPVQKNGMEKMENKLFGLYIPEVILSWVFPFSFGIPSSLSKMKIKTNPQRPLLLVMLSGLFPVKVNLLQNFQEES